MPHISIRLSERPDAKLSREAERTRRPKAELAREAIAEYLARRERARFLGQIARAARAPGEDPITLAEEALPLDNDALALLEGEVAPFQAT
jgi:predicted DNA-binding protein